MNLLISPYSHLKLRNGNDNPKNYPWWPQLIKLLQSPEINITQIGVEGEPKLVENCQYNLSMPKLKELIQDMDLFISVDNFFPHFCNHYKKYGIVLFGRSDPSIFGYSQNLNLFRDPKYLRPDQFGIWESAERIEDAFVRPEKVIEAINNL